MSGCPSFLRATTTERRRAASVKVNFIAVYFQPFLKGISECFHLRLALGVIAWHRFCKSHRTPSEKITKIKTPGPRVVFLTYWPNRRYVPPFGSKTGIHSAHFGLESGMVFEETIYWSVWTYFSFQFQMNKKERGLQDIILFGILI